MESDSPELTAIQLAVLQGDERSVSALLQDGANVNQQTARDIHILYTVCNKCVCDIKDRSYDTASVSRSDRVDGSLTESKSTIGSKMGMQTLMTDVIHSRVRTNDNVVRQVSSLSDTIRVTLCCRTGCKHEIEEQGKYDIRRNIEMHKGSTVLHLAVLMDNSKMAELLLTMGARSDLENSQSHTVFHLASKMDNAEMIESLSKYMKDSGYVSNSNRDHPIHTAVTYSSVNALKKILSKTSVSQGALINRFGKHPVHIAIQNNNVEILRILLCGLGNMDQKGYPECLSSALHFAVIHNSTDCGQVLIDSGYYDVNLCDSSGTPLLRIASRFGLDGMTSLLLQNGANVHTSSSYRQSALDMALEMTYLDQMLTLLSAGASFDRRSDNNRWAKEQMDMKLCISCDNKDNTKEKFLKLLLFGYKFSGTVLSLAKQTGNGTGHPWHDTVQLILTFSKHPLPLQRHAANCIIRMLHPNAWVSVKHLPLPNAIQGYLIQQQNSWD